MAEATKSSLRILQQSPLDQDFRDRSEPPPFRQKSTLWIASRFNVQTTTPDGSLVLWNTYRGTMSSFPAQQRDRVRSLLKRRDFEAEPEGLVKYLADRGFLVPVEADERQRFQHAFGERHYRTDLLQLTLLASEDCNFRCEYCYEKFARGTMLPWVREAIKRLVEQRLPALRFLNIAWFGGEPLYGFDAIRDLGSYFTGTSRNHGIQYSSSITTNGYLLTPETVDYLLAWGIRSYQVTIDGLPEDHDRLRRTRTGEGTFQTIFENLSAFTRRGEDFSMQVRVNFDPKSARKLEAFLDLLKGTFGDDSRFRLLVRPVGRWGGDKDPDLVVCGQDEARSIHAEIADSLHERGLDSYDDLRKMGRFGSHVCYAARPYHYIVGAHGQLMKCTVALDTDPMNILGQITPEGELNLDPDRVALWSEPVFAAVDKCQSCVILPLCHGMACPYQRIRGRDAHCPPVKKELRNHLLWTQRAAEPGGRTVQLKDSVP